MANTIDSQLQLTEVLDATLTGFREAILPLRLFSTVFEQVELKGDDTVAVPYYPIEGTRSRRRSAGQSYKSKVSGTTTGVRTITPSRNMIQGLSFTSEERARQPRLDPDKHGMLKGQRLGYDVLADVLSIVAAGTYTGTSIDPVSKANFDEIDVAGIAELCDVDKWPEEGRGLILSSGYHYNLATQGSLLDLSKSGSQAVLREADLPSLFKFREIGTAGLPTNNFDAMTFQGASADETLTVTLPGAYTDELLSDYYCVGARVVIAEGTTLPTGLAAGTYYVLTVDDTNNQITVSATPGGAVVNLTANGTADNTVARTENIAGIAVHTSALLTAFAPVPPSDGVRSKLVDYQIVTDQSSGAVLEYTRIAYDDTKEEAQFIECHYGMAPGEKAGLKIIRSA